MKKCFFMCLLACISCLTGCKSNNAVLTMDNWSDYLELRDGKLLNGVDGIILECRSNKNSGYDYAIAFESSFFFEIEEDNKTIEFNHKKSNAHVFFTTNDGLGVSGIFYVTDTIDSWELTLVSIDARVIPWN